MTVHKLSFAATLVEDLLADLTDRRGLRQAWDSIDADIRDDIMATWRRIVCDALDHALNKAPPTTTDPIPMLLSCPICGYRHIDADYADKPHHTHACQHCGHNWRPAVVQTVGVAFLPGFKDGNATPETFRLGGGLGGAPEISASAMNIIDRQASYIRALIARIPCEITDEERDALVWLSGPECTINCPPGYHKILQAFFERTLRFKAASTVGVAPGTYRGPG